NLPYIPFSPFSRQLSASSLWLLNPESSLLSLVIPNRFSGEESAFRKRGNNYFVLRFTMNASVRLLFRVLYPRVGCPHGVTGCRPPEVFPSPPPCGWSTGFIETPRFTGRRPNQRVRPALPMVMFS